MSYPRSEDELARRIQGATEVADRLRPRVAQFFQLGSRDADDLKRFLYYFLAIEIEVHQVFGSVSRVSHVTNAVTPISRVATSVTWLLEDRDANWSNLTDRFVWCVASVWEHLSDDDVVEFKRLKKIRDGIAHGRMASPKHSDVLTAERLLTRIIVVPGADVT